MDHNGTLVPTESAPGSWNLQWKLMCPACGITEVERAADGGDHGSVTVHPDRDAYDSPLGTRGGYLQVDLTCAAGHGFAFIMGNHKGEEFVGVVPRV
ncbi:hypothetical protein LRS74_15370 [Streptomyces sp. LX-29]|uniref:hypothetical protein n=1 Tax=Streptomyces sp. LX-29 TaxID=2900152 RepID=UPI00240DA2A3|nr:hypothetical protein [Streptomyces sp. LX-29]WFB08279.1 hypothetical protein LRS74_15370 [Streptomyces sp. LX-29]